MILSTFPVFDTGGGLLRPGDETSEIRFYVRIECPGTSQWR